MPKYQVIDPQGILYNDEPLDRGATFADNAHSARVRAWLRFGQIEEVSEKSPAPSSEPQPVPEISEAAKKLAEENGIDIAQVKGTGANGAIIKPDVEAAIEAKSK